MINEALKLCCKAHLDQTDKSGLPYYLHPIHLAYQMHDEDSIITALLHDVVEDSNYTIKDLENMGFSKNVCNAVGLLTRGPYDSYMDYIRRIKDSGNSIALAVKLADLRHNSDLSRFEYTTEKDEKRTNRYLKAISILETLS